MTSLSFQHQPVAYSGLFLVALLVGIAAHAAGAADSIGQATPSSR